MRPAELSEKLFAKWYPVVIGWSENAGQRDTRHRLMAQAEGRTLEIGAGNGCNLEHYTAAVTELVVTEPSPFMIEHLRAHLDSDPPPVGRWRLEATGAEALPFADGSFDTVVATYVHCSIPNPAQALAEIARVLKPGGRYLFMEHVRSDGAVYGHFQDLIAAPHRLVAAGCNPNRRTEQLLFDSPLTVESLVHEPMPRASLTVRPTIRGSAVKLPPAA
jgi:ubiquinone/menaquinone biosynthesis C-methylase UbiE